MPGTAVLLVAFVLDLIVLALAAFGRDKSMPALTLTLQPLAAVLAACLTATTYVLVGGLTGFATTIRQLCALSLWIGVPVLVTTVLTAIVPVTALVCIWRTVKHTFKLRRVRPTWRQVRKRMKSLHRELAGMSDNERAKLSKEHPTVHTD